MAVKFKEVSLHDRQKFMPGISLAFEDPNAEPYFIHAGWAEPTNDAPVHTYTKEEVTVDLDARHNESGAAMRDMIAHKGDHEKAKAAFRDRTAKEAAEAAKLDVQDVNVKAPSVG